MGTGPTVIVKKGGFFASIAGGVFALLITIVLCATGLTIYALHVVDGRVDNLISAGDTLASHARTWREILPPAVVDALDDRRAEQYDDNVIVRAEVDPAPPRARTARISFRVDNAGPETISLLGINVVLKDTEGRPLHDFRVYAATPLALGGKHWRGPLRAGHTREFAVWAPAYPDGVTVSTEISELRVLAAPGQGAPDAQEPQPSTAEAAPDEAPASALRTEGGLQQAER